MPKDVNFDYWFVPMRLEDAIQRAAVLYPLVGMVSGHDREAIERAIRVRASQLVGMWRERICALTSVGWSPRPGQPYSIAYCRNCMPAFVYTTPRTRACNFRWLCPFCWARWVRDIWGRIDSIFPNPRRNLQAQVDAVLDQFEGENLRSVRLDHVEQADFPFHLVEQQYTLLRSLVPESGTWSPVEWIGQYMQKLMSLRRGALRTVKHYGMFSLTTVEPTATGWRIRHRRLYKVAADYVLPDVIRGKVIRHERPSRSILFGAVARVCRYPTILIRGDPDRTLQWLDARQHYPVRLSALFGALRRNK